MGVSKVVFGDNTILDLTQDTVTASALSQGYTAHGADGEPIVGTGESMSGAVKYDQAQTLTSDQQNQAKSNIGTVYETYTLIPNAMSETQGYWDSSQSTYQTYRVYMKPGETSDWWDFSKYDKITVRFRFTDSYKEDVEREYTYTGGIETTFNDQPAIHYYQTTTGQGPSIYFMTDSMYEFESTIYIWTNIVDDTYHSVYVSMDRDKNEVHNHLTLRDLGYPSIWVALNDWKLWRRIPDQEPPLTGNYLIKAENGSPRWVDADGEKELWVFSKRNQTTGQMITNALNAGKLPVYYSGAIFAVYNGKDAMSSYHNFVRWNITDRTYDMYSIAVNDTEHNWIITQGYLPPDTPADTTKNYVLKCIAGSMQWVEE